MKVRNKVRGAPTNSEMKKVNKPKKIKMKRAPHERVKE